MGVEALETGKDAKSGGEAEASKRPSRKNCLGLKGPRVEP